MKNIYKGNQWHPANLLEQTWLKMTEHNCSLILVGGVFFWFWGGASALTFHQVQAGKNEESKKSQYLQNSTKAEQYFFCLLFQCHIFKLSLLWESKGARSWGDAWMTKIRHWDVRGAPVQSAGRVRLLSSHHIPTHRITKLSSLSSTGKRRWWFILFPATTTKHKQALHKQHHRSRVRFCVSWRRIYFGAGSARQRGWGEQCAPATPQHKPRSTGGAELQGWHTGLSARKPLRAIMPVITSHYRASRPQRSIMFSIWDVSFDLLTVEQELDWVPCFCSSEALRVSK